MDPLRLASHLSLVLFLAVQGACTVEGDGEFGHDDTDTDAMGDPVLETPRCHPLIQDCPTGLSCAATGDARSFDCTTLAVDPGGFGESCFSGLECGEGYFCSVSEVVVGCAEGFGCCAPFCDFNAANPGCGSPLSCVPFFGADPPPGFEDVGACAYTGG